MMAGPPAAKKARIGPVPKWAGVAAAPGGPPEDAYPWDDDAEAEEWPAEDGNEPQAEEDDIPFDWDDEADEGDTGAAEGGDETLEDAALIEEEEEVFQEEAEAQVNDSEDAVGDYEEAEDPNSAAVEAGDGEWHEGWEGDVQDETGEEGMAWDGAEEEAACAALEADNAFESFNSENRNEGKPERDLLARLRSDIAKIMPDKHIELEPFGSYVTELTLPTKEASARSDLDVVLLFHGTRSDSFEAKEIRDRVVVPTIEKLGRWLRAQPGISVKNVIKHARVPIVTFETKDLEVDISVQQPYGPLNSWHLRDLCQSGWPGRLRALIRLTKLWARSKAVHTAKDGALSSYGYAMLAGAFLRESGVMPALLPSGDKPSGPYVDSDAALKHVLNVCKARKGGKQPRLWEVPEETMPDGDDSVLSPEQLFIKWMDWLAESVLAFASKTNGVPGGTGRVPIARRYIASVRPRSQEELRNDVTWSLKVKDHWSPHLHEVYLMIEEPLNGENVARSVRMDGFRAIVAEVDRARKYLQGTLSRDAGGKRFRALLQMPPLSKRQQPPQQLGMLGVRPPQHPQHQQRGLKRPWEQGGGGKGVVLQRPGAGSFGAQVRLPAPRPGAAAFLRVPPSIRPPAKAFAQQPQALRFVAGRPVVAQRPTAFARVTVPVVMPKRPTPPKTQPPLHLQRRR